MTIDLRPFCDRNKRRNLHRPFTRGEFTYATDGALVIRVDHRADVPDNEKAPLAEGLPWPDASTVYAPPAVPGLPILEEIECPRCDGGQVHDCPTCHCECGSCDGSGRMLEPYSADVGEAIFSVKYLFKILVLPGIQFGPSKQAEPMPFRFDGGEGLLMPLTSRARKHVGASEDEAAA